MSGTTEPKATRRGTRVRGGRCTEAGRPQRRRGQEVPKDSSSTTPPASPKNPEGRGGGDRTAGRVGTPPDRKPVTSSRDEGRGERRRPEEGGGEGGDGAERGLASEEREVGGWGRGN